jgi:hypothetical protein
MRDPLRPLAAALTLALALLLALPASATTADAGPAKAPEIRSDAALVVDEGGTPVFAKHTRMQTATSCATAARACGPTRRT